MDTGFTGSQPMSWLGLGLNIMCRKIDATRKAVVGIYKKASIR